MAERTVLFDAHVAAGAKMVDFSGWDMPLNYGSQLDEHSAVRTSIGIFDVSHMTVVDLDGAGVRRFLARLLANDIARIDSSGKALYTCMLNHDGGVVDDLIVYNLGRGNFRLVVNAATRTKDLDWIGSIIQTDSDDVRLTERTDLAMIALQGPGARAVVATLFPDVPELVEVKPFHAIVAGDAFLARTGYTGEDGFEVLLPAADAAEFWSRLVDAGARPCGLGARDSLRLEAGLNLFGSDMDETTTPYESNLAWTVSLGNRERNFIGREALEKQLSAGVPRRLVGLVMKEKGVLRSHQRVTTSDGAGETTSGGFAPTLGHSIALARVPNGSDVHAEVEIRGRIIGVAIVKPPFVIKGKSNIE